jgi:hypothetical protein
MKYLINESQLEGVIYKYLDSIFENYTVEKGGILFHILVIRNGEQDATVGIDLEGDRVAVDYKLREQLQSMFSIDEEYANKIVKGYIKEKLNLD